MPDGLDQLTFASRSHFFSIPLANVSRAPDTFLRWKSFLERRAKGKCGDMKVVPFVH